MRAFLDVGLSFAAVTFHDCNRHAIQTEERLKIKRTADEQQHLFIVSVKCGRRSSVA